MNRRLLIRRIEKMGCELLREGGNHSIYVNRRQKKVTTIPRHNEIDDNLAKRIFKDLGLPRP
jgi:predicted RNA binding protein YcfA (HicA-like mRNA interferase family)